MRGRINTLNNTGSVGGAEKGSPSTSGAIEDTPKLGAATSAVSTTEGGECLKTSDDDCLMWKADFHEMHTAHVLHTAQCPFSFIFKIGASLCLISPTSTIYDFFHFHILSTSMLTSH